MAERNFKEKIIRLGNGSYETLKTIGEVADSLHYPCYVVGGWVRDLLLAKKNDDIDVVVVGSGKTMAEAVAKRIHGKVSIYESYGTAQILSDDGMEIEFVGARKEFYHRESRNPIVENGTLQDDMDRRDFTINDMAICLNSDLFGDFVDPYHGYEDLRDGIVRCVSNAKERFDEDPLRMLRCIRFATRFNFTIDDDTFQAMCELHDRLSIITKERILAEVNKMMQCEHPEDAIANLRLTGLLQYVLPELDKACGVEERNGKRHKDIFLHSLMVLRNVAQVSDNLYLRWAALLHDVGKVQVKAFKDGNWTFENHAEVGAKMIDKIFKRLTFPLDERMQYVKTLIRLHMRPMQLCEDGVTDAAVRRLLFDAGDTIDDLLILCSADITSSHRDKVEKFQKNYEFLKKRMVELEESDRLRNFQPPVDGNEIMELFNLTPGKIVGVLKEKVKDAILDGIIPNEHDAARAYVIEEFNKLNK